MADLEKPLPTYIELSDMVVLEIIFPSPFEKVIRLNKIISLCDTGGVKLLISLTNTTTLICFQFCSARMFPNQKIQCFGSCLSWQSQGPCKYRGAFCVITDHMEGRLSATGKPWRWGVWKGHAPSEQESTSPILFAPRGAWQESLPHLLSKQHGLCSVS